MKTQVVDMNTWLFPDSEPDASGKSIVLESARNADVCFQILTDQELPEGADFHWSWRTPQEGISLLFYELRPVNVKYNSGVKTHNAFEYEPVKSFVIRKAPFEIFDQTRPIVDGKLGGGKAAFWVRVNIDRDAVVGTRELKLQMTVGEELTEVTVTLKIHKTVLHDTAESPYSMCYWLLPDRVARVHRVSRGSQEYYQFVEKHLNLLADMRNTMFQLPTPLPICDQDGKVTGFDFSECDRYLALARKAGFRSFCSGFVAHWKYWSDPDYYLVWDMETLVESIEGYRQLKLYFEGEKEFIERNHLGEEYLQSLLDEPQVPNSMAYKALTCTFRTLLPGVRLIDPVETPDIAGSCDIWVIKQAVYETYKEKYDMLQKLGAEYWVYACGFPANKWMNHILDLPLTATRLGDWQGVRCGMTGYLHWGYMDVNDTMDPLNDTNYNIEYRGESRYYPPGNHAVVYVSKDQNIYESVRLHVRRNAAADGELLLRLRREDEKACNEIIDSVCTGFAEYTSDASLVEQARRALLEKLDNCYEERENR